MRFGEGKWQFSTFPSSFLGSHSHQILLSSNKFEVGHAFGGLSANRKDPIDFLNSSECAADRQIFDLWSFEVIRTHLAKDAVWGGKMAVFDVFKFLFGKAFSSNSILLKQILGWTCFWFPLS